MAEAVVVCIAESIVDYLVPQALDKVGMLCGVKQELKALKDRLVTLQAVLDDAEEKYQNQNRQIQVWLQKLKDAFYEAQDVLEEFTIEATRGDLSGHNKMCEEVRIFFSSSNQLAFRLKTYYKIRAVRMGIEAVKADRGLHLDERPKREWPNRETHSFIGEGDIIGREGDKKTVMKFLQDSNVEENVSILPIVGIGGLGKTTLAKDVYKDSKFDLKMWVCVSTDFDVQKIVKKMLASAKNEEPTENTMELLQSKLRANINGKKYLLVLDDVWNREQKIWLELKPLLMVGAKGSKILVTTRGPLVAKIMGTAPPYYLGGLSERASVELLMQMAGRNIEEIRDSGMLDIGKEIVRKCSRVPLVIRTVGSLLSLKSELEWSHFKDYELLEVSEMEDCIKSVLKLSYDHLPSHLKQCFAFCSLFPKDYEIKTQTLVNLWVAEGFIQPSNKSQHLEDIAHEYFMDLLGRSFFQDFKINPYRNEETCKMHDLMHDLASLVAGNECLVARDDTEFIHERTRHISYDPTFNLMGKLSLSRLRKSALRTFLSTARYEEDRSSPSEADLYQLIQNFKRLRILDLHCTEVEKVPPSIYKLKHLTYLDLSHNHRLKRLPNSITRLRSLQTLKLYDCRNLEELPSDIRKLVSLRNLDIDECLKLSYLPRGLGELSSLHRLTHFILPKDKARAKNYCGLGELKGLNNIRGRLSITNLRYVTNAEECENANLMGKHSLEFLELDLGYFNTDDEVIANRDEALLDGLKPPSNLQELMICNYGDESFPSWIMNISKELTRLIEVWFYECKRCKRLPQLGQLSHLKSLRIYNMPELEYIEWDQSSPSTALFPRLSELDISYCEKLKAVSLTPSDESSTSTASFVSLSELTIRGCEILEAMPPTPHLEELTLTQNNGAVLINPMMLGLNKLKALSILNIKFPGCLPEGFQSLTSLESLWIMECQLTSLSKSMRHLSSLERLCINRCYELDISKDESGNILDFHGALQSLRSVKLSILPKLTSLPQWLLQARNLEYLEIWSCNNLKDIPEQIEALQSLQNLNITCCPSLTSFPEAMRSLTSLTHLRIYLCGELDESCKRQAGEDWDKIAHIPNKQFD